MIICVWCVYILEGERLGLFLCVRDRLYECVLLHVHVCLCVSLIQIHLFSLPLEGNVCVCVCACLLSLTHNPSFLAQSQLCENSIGVHLFKDGLVGLILPPSLPLPEAVPSLPLPHSHTILLLLFFFPFSDFCSSFPSCLLWLEKVLVLENRTQ